MWLSQKCYTCILKGLKVKGEGGNQEESIRGILEKPKGSPAGKSFQLISYYDEGEKYGYYYCVLLSINC